MNHALLGENGTVMQFVGDAVMAVFGAPFPQPDQCERAVAAADAMHTRQAELNARWEAKGLPPFHLGIGVSTGDVAAALLGSDERLEYSVVGDAVNLAQRLQQWAEGGQTVLSEPTYAALTAAPARRTTRTGAGQGTADTGRRVPRGPARCGCARVSGANASAVSAAPPTVAAVVLAVVVLLAIAYAPLFILVRGVNHATVFGLDPAARRSARWRSR